MTMDAGIPEQAVNELKDYKEDYTALLEIRMKLSNLEMHCMAKGMAMQQAGIIPLNSDEEFLYQSVETALTLEGLLKGY